MSRLIHSEYTFYEYVALVIIVSFLGFCLENIWLVVRKGQIDNRNMNFPFLIGYGMAILFIYFLLGVPQKGQLWLFFLTAFLIVSVGEIILGFSVEKFCGIYYWDYSTLPLHVTRYTSFFTSIGFAAIITCFFYRFFTPLMTLIKDHDCYRMHVFCIAMLAVMIIDFIYSFKYMHDNRALYSSWILHFPVHGSVMSLERMI
jgi:uncharacterized membrane protein